MKLKVYAWQDFRSECPPAPNGSRQTREICAAKSKAEVARIAGESGPWKLFNLGETGNANEIETAMKEPGVIFWRSINDYREKPKFTRAHPSPQPLPEMNAKYDDRTIKLTPRFERALVELLKAQCEMMKKRQPEYADCWTWGRANITDLASTVGIEFTFGSDEDMNQERPRFDITTEGAS